MKNPPIHLYVDDAVEDGTFVRRVRLEGVQAENGPVCDVWWRFPGLEALPELKMLDSIACGFALWASVLNQDIHVHGPMTASGIRNWALLNETRRESWPGRYHRIEIMPDRIITLDRDPHTRGKTLAAFSGGVDSMFTVVRHAKKLLGPRSYPIEGLMLVLGFDVPLNRADRFEIVKRRAARFAASLDLPLYIAETNALAYSGGTWPQSAMPLFGATLSQFTGSGGRGIVSGGAPYGSAYGSFSHTPHLDTLCTNDGFELVTDGSGFHRADKLELLLNYPEYLKDLRVCWEGDDPSRNCGACAKCIVTRLDFLAVGVRHPACFDEPISKRHIAGLPLDSVTKARDFFRFCLEELDARNVRGAEADYLRRRLSRVPPDHLSPGLITLMNRVQRGLSRCKPSLPRTQKEGA